MLVVVVVVVVVVAQSVARKGVQLRWFSNDDGVAKLTTAG
jgi:hypothetical protein